MRAMQLLITCIYWSVVLTRSSLLPASPSKLLNLSHVVVSPGRSNNDINNAEHYTHYFDSVQFTFEIADEDEIETVRLDDAGQLWLGSAENVTLLRVDLALHHKHMDMAATAFDLHFDHLNEWDEIYENGRYESIRRRLGWWNVAKHKGRYVADGVTRRFKDAQNNCRHLYGDLASIMSKEEEEQVKDLCAAWNLGNCWMGYKKPWGHWEDGRRPTYLHWKPGEPNNYGGNEGCAEIHTSGQWNDIKCKMSRIAICERPRIHVVGHYVAVMRSLNWKDANKRCQELFSTDLATIENARENIMVRRACAAFNVDAECWIGLRRPWRTWVDGEDAKITNWADGQPNQQGNQADCALVQNTMRWASHECGDGKFFVCNTITQDVRIRKRAEAKRRAQEREAELEKKRKAMEDQIINQYMQNSQNGMTEKMLTGQSLYGGQNGIGSFPNQMMAYGGGAHGGYPGGAGGGFHGGAAGLFQQLRHGQTSPSQLHGFNQQQHQQHQMQGGQLHHALDAGYNVGTMTHQQLKGTFGDLGELGPNGVAHYVPGQPLQIKLVGRRRRRLQEEWMESITRQSSVDDVYGHKCRRVSGVQELCVGRNSVTLKRYRNSTVADMPLRVFRTRSRVVVKSGAQNMTADRTTTMMMMMPFMTQKWTSTPSDDDFVQHFLTSQPLVLDGDSGDDSRCMQLELHHQGSFFDVCVKREDKNGDAVVLIEGDETNAMRFSDDSHWNEIERIHHGDGGGVDVDVTQKCSYISVDMQPVKLCLEQSRNEELEITVYKASAHQLAASAHRDYMWNL